jgi:hypothetical protein
MRRIRVPVALQIATSMTRLIIRGCSDMIRHCVFLKFRPDIGDAEKQAVYSQLNDLRDVIPGISAASFGPNISPEGKNRGYDDGFTMDFADMSVRDAYLIHPQHREAGQALVSLLEGGRDGLMVFDIEV